MDFQRKLEQLLKRSKIRNTRIRFNDFTKNNNCYTYIVRISRADLLDSRDCIRPSYYNYKVRTFNSLVKKEITYADIDLQYVTSTGELNYNNYVTTKLKVKFKNE